MNEREALAALAREHRRAMLHVYDDPAERGTNCRQCDALTLFAERATQAEHRPVNAAGQCACGAPWNAEHERATQAEAGLDVERLARSMGMTKWCIRHDSRHDCPDALYYHGSEAEDVAREYAALAATPKEPVT